MAIVNGGRLVAHGTVGELRSHGAQGLWRVEVGGTRDGWAGAVAGVTEQRREGDVTVVRLAAGADGQALLDAARAAGPVRRCEPVAPSLSERFREVVAE